MSDEQNDALDSLDTGLDALVLVDVARELLEVVDVEALQNGVAVEEAVDGQQLRGTLGGPVGRVVARRLADRVVGSGVSGLVAREVAGRAGASLVEYLIEQVDPETLGQSLEELVEESGAAPSGEAVEDPVTVDINDDE